MPGLVDLADIQKEHRRIGFGQQFDGCLCGHHVGLGVILAHRWKKLTDVGRADDMLLNRNPANDRDGVRVRLSFLEPREKVRVLVVVLDLEVIVQHTMLVGPDAGQNARPAGAADGVVARKSISQDLAIGVVAPVGYQAIEIRRVGGLHGIEAATVDAQEQDLLHLRRRIGCRCRGIRREQSAHEHDEKRERLTRPETSTILVAGHAWRAWPAHSVLRPGRGHSRTIDGPAVEIKRAHAPGQSGRLPPRQC